MTEPHIKKRIMGDPSAITDPPPAERSKQKKDAVYGESMVFLPPEFDKLSGLCHKIGIYPLLLRKQDARRCFTASAFLISSGGAQ